MGSETEDSDMEGDEGEGLDEVMPEIEDWGRGEVNGEGARRRVRGNRRKVKGELLRGRVGKRRTIVREVIAGGVSRLGCGECPGCNHRGWKKACSKRRVTEAAEKGPAKDKGKRIDPGGGKAARGVNKGIGGGLGVKRKTFKNRKGEGNKREGETKERTAVMMERIRTNEVDKLGNKYKNIKVFVDNGGNKLVGLGVQVEAGKKRGEGKVGWNGASETEQPSVWGFARPVVDILDGMLQSLGTEGDTPPLEVGQEELGLAEGVEGPHGKGQVRHRMVNWNVQGVSLVANDLYAMITREGASLALLTEVKGAKGEIARLDKGLGSRVYSTSAGGKEGGKGDDRKGGVVAIVSPRMGKAEYISTPKEFKGYILELLFRQVQHPGLRVIGVYVPPGQEERALRKRLVKHVEGRVKAAAGKGEMVLVRGDFNPGSTKYKGCTEMGETCRPVRVAPEGHTWFPSGAPPKTNDFWLTYKPERGKEDYWGTQYTKPVDLRCKWGGGCSDHLPVFVDVWLSGEGEAAPQVTIDVPGGVRFPLRRHTAEEKLDKFSEALTDRLAPEICVLRGSL
jgi:hypothetical protein